MFSADSAIGAERLLNEELHRMALRAAAEFCIRQSRSLQVAVLSEDQENKVDGVQGLRPV